jgi:predicted transposase YbfD/YdcC
VSLCVAEPLASGFPFSRTIVQIVSRRTIKKTGKSSEETRYYLASQDAGERTPEDWINLSRSHWAGVENRNHWRRDATLGEDGTRLRQPRALANLALLRSVGLRLLVADGADDWLPAQRERLATDLPALFRLIQAKL